MFDRELRDLTFVQRWGILRRSRAQNVPEHSYYVALYAIETARFIEWEGDMARMMHHALAHDIPEVWTGDVPGPSKRQIVDRQLLFAFEEDRMRCILPTHAGAYGETDPEIKAIVAFADVLEAVLYLADEFNMGNRSVGEVDDRRSPLGANIYRMAQKIAHLPCLDSTQEKLTHMCRIAVNQAMNGISRIVID